MPLLLSDIFCQCAHCLDLKINIIEQTCHVCKTIAILESPTRFFFKVLQNSFEFLLILLFSQKATIDQANAFIF